jgi:hypothetical protein
MQQMERLLFVNQKKQKNLIKLGRAGFAAAVSSMQKFLRRFFKKRLLLPKYVEPPWPLALTSSQGLLVQVGASYPDRWTGQSQLPREMLNGPGDDLPDEPGSSKTLFKRP